VIDILAGPGSSPTRKTISIVSSFIILISLGAYVSSQFQGAGKTFSETFDLPLSASILVGGGIVIFYTLLGGFWAVSVTDTLQGLLMAVTAVILPIAAVVAVGGPVSFWSGFSLIQEPGFQSLTRHFAPVSALGFILGILGIGLGYPGQPHVVNRFMALEEKEGAMKKARRIAISWAVVVYAGMLILGFCGRILVPELPDPEVIFITLTNQLFPPAISGIMIAAVLSAIMSTADSQLLVASSSVTHDLGLVHHTRLSQLGLSRLVVLLISCGAIVAALYGSREIFSQVLFAWAAMGSAFGPVLLLMMLGKVIQLRARLASIVLGFSLSVTSFYAFSPLFPWKGAMERFFPFILAFAIAWWVNGRTDSQNTKW
jgi:sodium/proline symporter